MFAEPALPPLYSIVRRRLKRMIRASSEELPELLDVGGRKSHYTIGLAARVTVTDLPRRSALQERLNLGVTDTMVRQLRARRSNIWRVMLDDMTHSALPDSSFDCVVAVEVIEHVADDEAFVREIHRVLKPGGWFLATTPNGDARPNTNPDHKRHYRRAELQTLLSRYFPVMGVDYAIRDGLFHSLGLRSWSMRRPIRAVVGMAANLVSGLPSRRSYARAQAFGTCHLIATTRKEEWLGRNPEASGAGASGECSG
jgi:SAM-dependent methyltransferase